MQAVHSGADLESAISNCMGYKSEVTTRQIRPLLSREPSCSYILSDFHAINLHFVVPQGQGFMVGVKINPVPGLPTGFPVMLINLL